MTIIANERDVGDKQGGVLTNKMHLHGNNTGMGRGVLGIESEENAHSGYTLDTDESHIIYNLPGFL